MILIVDSGSTKTDWIAINKKGEKLFEELSIRKNFYKTKVKDIFSTKEPTYRNQDINNLLNKLKYNLYFKNQNYLKRQIFLFLNKEK